MHHVFALSICTRDCSGLNQNAAGFGVHPIVLKSNNCVKLKAQVVAIETEPSL